MTMLRYRLREFRYALHPGMWYGLQNLWAYFPLIWRDRDWDWCYMVALWEKKFRRQADHANHVGKERDAQQLRLCAALCRRIRAADYETPAYDAHWKKWNGPRSDLERREFDRITKSEESRKRQDMELLCEMIRKHLHGWWD